MPVGLIQRLHHRRAVDVLHTQHLTALPHPVPRLQHGVCQPALEAQLGEGVREAVDKFQRRAEAVAVKGVLAGLPVQVVVQTQPEDAGEHLALRAVILQHGGFIRHGVKGVQQLLQVPAVPVPDDARIADQGVDGHAAEDRIQPPVHLRGPQRSLPELPVAQCLVAADVRPQVLQKASAEQLLVGHAVLAAAQVDDVGDFSAGHFREQAVLAAPAVLIKILLHLDAHAVPLVFGVEPVDCLPVHALLRQYGVHQRGHFFGVLLLLDRSTGGQRQCRRQQ